MREESGASGLPSDTGVRAWNVLGAPANAMSEPTDTFACSVCGKRYRWKLELAGKRVRCSCGASVTVPTEEPWYDLAPKPQEPPPVPTAPHATTALAEIV